MIIASLSAICTWVIATLIHYIELRTWVLYLNIPDTQEQRDPEYKPPTITQPTHPVIQIYMSVALHRVSKGSGNVIHRIQSQIIRPDPGKSASHHTSSRRLLIPMTRVKYIIALNQSNGKESILWPSFRIHCVWLESACKLSTNKKTQHIIFFSPQNKYTTRHRVRWSYFGLNR